MGTPTNIADQLSLLKNCYSAAALSLSIIHHPRFQDILGIAGVDLGSTTGFGKQDGSYYRNDVFNSLLVARANKTFNLKFLESYLVIVVLTIDNELKTADLRGKTKELEFFRHVRNAMSHGNRFDFLDRRTKMINIPMLAEFNQFKLTSDLHDTNLYDFLMLGDILDLLDYIEMYLRSISA